LEVAEHEGKLVVTAELPGLKKEEVSVEIGNDALVLQGLRRRTHHDRRDGWYQSERSYGRFYRSIPLPEGANIDKAQAEFSNGILEVSIPIPESKTMRRQIPVQEAKAKPASN
jgi:HSP20 family protein